MLPEEEPGWLRSLIEALRVRLVLPGKRWDGMDYIVDCERGETAADTSMYDVHIYPRPVRVLNDGLDYEEEIPHEEYVAYPPFTVDVTSVLELFDSVSAIGYNCNEMALVHELEGDRLSILGEYHGQPVGLYIYSLCPRRQAENLHRQLAMEYGWEDEEEDDERESWQTGDDDEMVG